MSASAEIPQGKNSSLAERGCLSRSTWLATGAWNNPPGLNVRALLRLAFSTAALRQKSKPQLLEPAVHFLEVKIQGT